MTGGNDVVVFRTYEDNRWHVKHSPSGASVSLDVAVVATYMRANRVSLQTAIGRLTLRALKWYARIPTQLRGGRSD